MADLRLLGPVELLAAGDRLNIGPLKQQAALAALVVDANRPVPIELVIDRLWGETPPARARGVVHSYVARLRQVLSEANAADGSNLAVEHRPAGYVLHVDPGQVDVHRLRGAVDSARRTDLGAARRAELLRGALHLWRGQPLAGLPGAWAASVRDDLRQVRLTAVLTLASTELELGTGSTMVDRLQTLLAEYPLVEPLVAASMRALACAGRAAEALECYAEARQRLRDELGTDPGPALQQVHRAILRGELGAAPASAPVPRPDVPAHLPLDLQGFVGRHDELAELDAVLAAAARHPTAVAVCALTGTAGVGKTALAIHWAYRSRRHFPDGQLYVNLRGFDPSRPVTSPDEAVRGFLAALGLPAARIPAGLDAQTGLYRSLLNGKRMLVVLDNARDADHVRPLLPGAPGCLALITSRSALTSLVALDGAHLLPVEVLPAGTARELLGRRLGAARVAAEPRATDQIIQSCARLPLALAIVAARAAGRPRFGLEVLARELGQAHGGLDALHGGDHAADVRTAFSWSYRSLSREAAALFRLLGLQPGPDITTPAVASLAGLPAGEVRPLLDELCRAHLVVEEPPGRFSFHDLLRAYACEQNTAVDDDDQRHAATRRIFDHYVHTAYRASLLLHPHRERIELPPPPPGCTPEGLPDLGAAHAWFTVERAVLLATVRDAARAGNDQHVWRLAWAMDTFLFRQGHWHDQAVTQDAALAAAQRLSDRRGQAYAHRSLAHAFTNLGRFEDSCTHYGCALDLFTDLGDVVGQAQTHRHLAWTFERNGRPADALAHAERALTLSGLAHHRLGRAEALNLVAWYRALLGDHPSAIFHGEQALALQRELGNRAGEANACDTLGYAYHHLGRHRQAITHYQRAVELFRQIGDRPDEAEALVHLGDAYDDSREPEAARASWQRALVILDELEHVDADPVRARLDTRVVLDEGLLGATFE